MIYLFAITWLGDVYITSWWTCSRRLFSLAIKFNGNTCTYSGHRVSLLLIWSNLESWGFPRYRSAGHCCVIFWAKEWYLYLFGGRLGWERFEEKMASEKWTRRRRNTLDIPLSGVLYLWPLNIQNKIAFGRDPKVEHSNVASLSATNTGVNWEIWTSVGLTEWLKHRNY